MYVSGSSFSFRNDIFRNSNDKLLDFAALERGSYQAITINWGALPLFARDFTVGGCIKPLLPPNMQVSAARNCKPKGEEFLL